MAELTSQFETITGIVKTADRRAGRRVYAAIAVALITLSAPCLAQSAATRAAGSVPAMAHNDVVAFATLSLSVAQVRDSIQKQLAQPRNKTPQAQQQLRDQLATQVAGILQRAGVSG